MTNPRLQIPFSVILCVVLLLDLRLADLDIGA
jgi:hypothetical protein